MKKQLVVSIAAFAMLASAAGAQPMPMPMQGDRGHMDSRNSGGCFPGERRDDCRERLRVEQRSHHRYVYRDGRYESQDNTGAAIAGGILGFMLGAAIAGSSHDRDYYNTHRNERGWRTRCRSAYRSFDSRSGTYLGSDGYRHYCTR